MRLRVLWIMPALAIVLSLSARTYQEPPPAQEAGPSKLSLCELKKDPAAYNHKLVELTGFVSRGFEDFTLFDPSWSSSPEVWLEYGGTSKSGTMYCCGVTADRERPEQLVVEQLRIPLIEDAQFREFDRRLQRRGGSITRATLVGRFFSGKQVKYPRGTFWGGYGHMGCCSLLAIQQVVAVDTQERPDLDYDSSADQPDVGPGCSYDFLSDIRPLEPLLKAQQAAEKGQTDWVFEDPQRVATEGLARLIPLDPRSLKGLRQTRKAQGRFVYEWRPRARGASYMVVVSRPYWLSFYAQDAQRVAWTVIAAYRASCGYGRE